jgi:hypothetical protein
MRTQLKYHSEEDQDQTLTEEELLMGWRSAWKFFDRAKEVANHNPRLLRAAANAIKKHKPARSLVEVLNTLQKAALDEDTIYVVRRIIKWRSRSSQLLTVRYLIKLLDKRMTSAQVRKTVSMLRNKGLIAVDPLTNEISPNKDLIDNALKQLGEKL